MKCGHCGTTGSFVTVEHVWNCAQHGNGPFRPAPVVAPGIYYDGDPTKPLKAAPVTEEGVYFDGEDYYKVVRSMSSNNLYAKVWAAESDSLLRKGWNYAPGAVGRLTADMRVTAEQAARFGRLTNQCVFCSRKLTDDREKRSVEVGYGPTCAKREGLPWG